MHCASTVQTAINHHVLLCYRIWVQGPMSWRGKYYQYRITVFCPDSQQLQTLITTDPYSLSLAADGTHTQVRYTTNTLRLF